MSEKRGIIVEYNPTNRVGKIRPEDNSPPTLFYLSQVANPEPAPKPRDSVLFDAPPPRKNKKGKLVQEHATSVTIDQRAPESGAPKKEQTEKQRIADARRKYDFDPRRPKDRSQSDERRGRPGGKGGDRRGPGGARPGGARPGRGDAPRDGQARDGQTRDPQNRRVGRDGERRRFDQREPGERTGERAGQRFGADSRRGDRTRNRTATGTDRRSDKRDDRTRPRPQDKIKTPWGRDLPAVTVHLELSNPSLVFDKFIQWPREQPPQQPKRNPGAPGQISAGEAVNKDVQTLAPRANSPLEEAQPATLLVDTEKTPLLAATLDCGVAPATTEPAVLADESIGETPESTNREAPDLVGQASEATSAGEDAQVGDAQAPNAQPDGQKSSGPRRRNRRRSRAEGPPVVGSWKLLPKHKQYFLTRTVAQLYRNYERRTLPWTPVRARREAMLRALEQSGYSVATELVRGPWRFAVDGLPLGILGDAPLSFDRTFGYPTIPAENLRRLLDRYRTQKSSPSDSIADSIILDAVPASKVGQFTIEEVPCKHPVWSSDGELAADPATSRTTFALCSGVDAGFLISVAVRDASVERKAAKALLQTLVEAVKSANTAYSIEAGSAADSPAASAVLF